jgi:hypothetical protein
MFFFIIMILYFSILSSLKRKGTDWLLIWAYKGSIVKKKIKKINQIKNFKKKSLLQSTIIYEEMHNKNYYIEMVTQLSVLLILSLFDYKITKNLYFCMIINQTYIYMLTCSII